MFIKTIRLLLRHRTSYHGRLGIVLRRPSHNTLDSNLRVFYKCPSTCSLRQLVLIHVVTKNPLKIPKIPLKSPKNLKN